MRSRKWFEFTNFQQLLCLTSRCRTNCRISRCRIFRCRIVVHVRLLCFSFVWYQDHKLTCRLEAGFGEEDNSHRLLLALLLSCGKGLHQAVE